MLENYFWKVKVFQCASTVSHRKRKTIIAAFIAKKYLFKRVMLMMHNTLDINHKFMLMMHITLDINHKFLFVVALNLGMTCDDRQSADVMWYLTFVSYLLRASNGPI